MTVDQKELYPDQSGYAVKQCSDGMNHDYNPDPILHQGSLIMSGHGRAVVLAVGARTLRQKEIKDEDFNFEAEETPM